MKILIVRHGDPDYAIDGLTEIGKLEAELLSERLVKENIPRVYCSTMGRARLTAKPTLEKLGIEAEYFDFLREFSCTARPPYLEEPAGISWDLLPEYVNTVPELYSNTGWRDTEYVKSSDIAENYDRIVAEFDKLLERHGYDREGCSYRAARSNHDTLVFVCHFGLSAVLISHLMNCSPFSIWQNVCAAPTSVTTVYTEERREGIASMRIASIGDVSHLYAAGREPSFAARFCECYNDGTRRD